MTISSYTAFHFTALFGALALHVALAGWAIQLNSPVVIPENQIIQISMVVPTVVKEKKVEQELVVKQELQPVLPPKKKGMIKLDKESVHTKQEKEKKDVRDEVRMRQLTSGLASHEAMQLNSAITKPVAAGYLNNPSPRYPERARLRKQQGTVLLDVYVKADGKPNDVSIVKSSGYHLLDQAALQTVRLWKFIPARRGSKNVEANVEIPITFRIN